MKIIGPILCTLLIAACTTTTGVVPIGSGVYMLGEQAGWDYSGSKVKARLYQQASEYCATKGAKVVPVNSAAQDAGWQYASAEIQFRCTHPLSADN